MGTIYLLRHGETEWNVQRRKQGHLNSPLTARGRDQARESGRKLVGLLGTGQVSLFAASPLGRAQDTAGIVADEIGGALPALVTEPRLAEHHMGDWQGLTNAEIDERFPGVRKSRKRSPWHYVIPGGESYERLQERASSWLADVASEPVVVAVAHAMINRTLMGAFNGKTPEETLALEHPHGVVYRLRDGRVEAVG